MNPSEIRAALAELDLHPSKSLGQNFLADTNLARWIVDRLELSAGDHLVEIGPGLGSLTECAAPACSSLTLIEKDARLVAVLKERFSRQLSTPDSGLRAPPLELLHQDAL